METTIFYGNGVNLLGDNGISWNKLLESVSQGKRLLPLSSYTLKYESIVLPLEEITHAVIRVKNGRRVVTADGHIVRTSVNTEISAIKGEVYWIWLTVYTINFNTGLQPILFTLLILYIAYS